MTSLATQPRVVAVGQIPNDQKFVYKITPMPGRLMMAKTLGGVLSQLDKLFAALGADMDPPAKTFVAISEIHTNEDGSIEFGIVILDRKSHEPPS